MNLFKVWIGYRNIGINYGLPVFYVDLGPGIKKEPLQIMEILRDKGLNIDRWVVIRGNLASEKTAKTLIEGLKAVNVMVEVEDNGRHLTPAWFPKVDRWIVDWVPNPEFNYSALRPRRDILICKNGNLEAFIEKTSDLMVIRAAIGNKEELLPLAAQHGIRIYEEDD